MNNPNQESSTWKKTIGRLWEKVLSIIITIFSGIALLYFVVIIYLYVG